MNLDRESHASYAGWRVVAASGIGVFFATQTFFVFAILLKPLTLALGGSREAVAAGFGVMTLASALTAPFLGHLLDRFGLHRIAWLCLAVIGLALLLLSRLVPSLGPFYATLAVIGIATAGTSGVAYARAIATWFDRRRGLALALVLSASAIGAILVPPLAQALLGRFGWRGTCAVLGGAVLLLGVGPVQRFARERESAGPRDRVLVPGRSVGEATRSRGFWTLAAIVFASTLALNGLLVHLSAMLTDRGLAPARAALVVSMVGAATLLGRVATGWLLDRLPARRLLVVLLAFAGTGTLLLARSDSLALILVGALLAGFGTGGELDIVPYLLSRYFGLRSLSTLFGIVWSCWGLAGAIGPTLLGRAFDAAGSYEGTLVNLGVLTLGAASLAWTLPAASPAPAAASAEIA